MDETGSRALREIPPLHFQNFKEDPLSLHQLQEGEKSPVKIPDQQQHETSANMPDQHDERMPTTLEDLSAASHPAYDREASPPLTLSPTLALDAVPQLDRSVSTASSISSRRSSSSRLSDSGLSSSKRRGYMRPQVTNYSESAKNRESVMNLGSIAHLQYYFARTGLLDGKGGQLAREDMLKRKSSSMSMRAASMNAGDGSAEGPGGLLSPSLPVDSCAISDSGLTESPTEQDGAEPDWGRGMMLPPTVSTYNQRPIYVAPPPDLTMLRRELTEALEDALKVLKETDKSPDDAAGWYEIQGLHLLDIITLAIRAARNYYTAHTEPQRLYQFRSERKIRNDLYQVLEILKRMAGRNFAGGIRQTEKVEILTWIVGISELIQSEIDQEKREQEERERFRWRAGDWTGREREREELFLRSFMESPQDMPTWADPSDDSSLPTSFLKFFQNGLRLVTLHNELVRKSKRQFEEIKTWHTDTAKPYRMAENLRFWIKAAQLRWDITLELDTMAVVRGEDPAAWKQFDAALLKWCRGVREEIMAGWIEGRVSPRRTTTLPTLRIEPSGTPEGKKHGKSSLEVKATELTPVS